MARIAPEKGLHLLASAYIRMRRELGLQPSRLEAAGYLAPEHRTYLDGVTQALAAVGLEGEFRCHGTVDRPQKIAFLQGLDVLSVPSPYAEPKGLYLLEALATGVPVVRAAPRRLPRARREDGRRRAVRARQGPTTSPSGCWSSAATRSGAASSAAAAAWA